MTESDYDVAIVGAGPAGATAAILLAGQGVRVALVDRQTFPRPVARAGWLSAKAFALLEEIGVKPPGLRDRACRNVCFYKEDFSASAQPSFTETPAYLIDRTDFDHTLVKAAAAAGCTLLDGTEVTDVQCGESSVRVVMGEERNATASVLLMATGRDPRLLDRIGTSVAVGGASAWAGQVECPLDGKTVPKESRIAVVLGVGQSASFGLICVGASCLSISLTWTGPELEATPALISLCRRMFEHKIVPVDLAGQASAVKPVATPVSAALDMETHVGKRSLVIGEAGGFVSAVSNEGIYPSMWSAQIAAEVTRQTLQSASPQEELMSFDSLWRIRMADYLRSPHTDIQFLLPLIFTNQPMADRMGAAFFFGDNI